MQLSAVSLSMGPHAGVPAGQLEPYLWRSCSAPQATDAGSARFTSPHRTGKSSGPWWGRGTKADARGLSGSSAAGPEEPATSDPAQPGAIRPRLPGPYPAHAPDHRHAGNQPGEPAAQGGAVAARLGRPFSGQFRACIRELVDKGRIVETGEGQFRAVEHFDDGESTPDAEADAGQEDYRLEETDDLPDLTPANLHTLELEILRVVAAAGRPLAGKVVASPLNRKHSGWIKSCLARLVKLGLLV